MPPIRLIVSALLASTSLALAEPPLEAMLETEVIAGADLPILRGKVVVLVVVDELEPASVLATLTVQRLVERFDDDGLVGAIVHTGIGWDQMLERATDGRVTLPMLKDEGQRVRTAVAGGEDEAEPGEVILIDRAGVVRDRLTDRGQVIARAAVLVAETRGEAEAAAEAEAFEKAAAEAARKERFRALDLPVIEQAAYDEANWPAHGRDLSAKDVQGRPMPAQFGREIWLTEEFPLEGRVLILDFWATWCGPCHAAAPMLETAHRAHMGEAEVVAISGMNDPEERVADFIRERGHGFTHLWDGRQNLATAFGVQGIPHTAIISTDGVVRWQGDPRNPKFLGIVKQIIDADPMIRARRSAE